MAIKDYNGIAFKNTAIDKMSGSFNQGPGDGKKKSTSTTSATLPNPWSKPKPQAVTAPTIKKPASTVMPAAKPSTTVSTTADNATASTKTLKTVKAENKIKKAEAKGNAVVDKINKRANMTAEEKEAKRGKFGSAVERGLEIAGTTLGLYGTYQGLKKKD
jgi:hypothetical protein